MYRVACLIGCTLLVAACETRTTEPAENQWEASLQGEVGWEHIGGTATVVSAPGTGVFVATAQITGDESGAVRPWHVHFNTCAEGGGIVGSDGDYPRLEVGANGTATASVTIVQPLELGANYHVNVHHSDGDLGTIIACGDLVLTS